MTLKIEDGIIIESVDGDFIVPTSIETPIRLERFSLSPSGEIEINPLFDGLSNLEVDAKVIRLTEQKRFEEKRDKIMESIWSLLTIKEEKGKKEIRGKAGIRDEDFIQLSKKDARRLASAKAGLDVFPLQAQIKGVTQAQIRDDIIAKATQYESSVLALDDKLDGVRMALEQQCHQASTDEDLSAILLKIKKLSELTLGASESEIAAILMS